MEVTCKHVSRRSALLRLGLDAYSIYSFKLTPTMDSWYVLAPVDRGGATSTPRNSCSFGRKKIIKTGICSLRLGKYKNTYFPEILDCCGGITRKSCDPCKKQGPKHTSCTIVDTGCAALGPCHVTLTSQQALNQNSPSRNAWINGSRLFR
jgi:hypothetical protein